ncbi:hypothetical protein HOD08_02870 [bacterium]|jgi:hypothetical protein|nr:hypothetical protein [bacterium]
MKDKFKIALTIAISAGPLIHGMGNEFFTLDDGISKPIIRKNVPLREIFEIVGGDVDFAKTVIDLRLQDDNLEVVPDEIGNFENLERLLILKSSSTAPIKISEKIGKLKTLKELVIQRHCPVLPKSLREKICTPGSTFNLYVNLEPAFFYKEKGGPTSAFVNFTNGPGRFECNGTIYRAFMKGPLEESLRAFTTGTKISCDAKTDVVNDNASAGIQHVNNRGCPMHPDMYIKQGQLFFLPDLSWEQKKQFGRPQLTQIK